MGQWNGVELDDLVLASARLVLRPWQEADAAVITAFMADPAMLKFVPFPDPYTQDDAVRYITEVARPGRSSGSAIDCALVERGSGELVGAAGLRAPGTRTNAAEIGYWVAPASQGNGYAAEAARSLATWAFERGESPGRDPLRRPQRRLGQGGAQRGIPLRGDPAGDAIGPRRTSRRRSLRSHGDRPGDPIAPCAPASADRRDHGRRPRAANANRADTPALIEQ